MTKIEGAKAIISPVKGYVQKTICNFAKGTDADYADSFKNGIMEKTINL